MAVDELEPETEQCYYVTFTGWAALVLLRHFRINGCKYPCSINGSQASTLGSLQRISSSHVTYVSDRLLYQFQFSSMQSVGCNMRQSKQVRQFQLSIFTSLFWCHSLRHLLVVKGEARSVRGNCSCVCFPRQRALALCCIPKRLDRGRTPGDAC